MMLVVLLIGSAASLVMMSFPAARQNNAIHQLARFQAQLEFAQDDGQQSGRLLGILVRPDGWRFQILQRRRTDQDTPQRGSDLWHGYFWQEWQPRRAALTAQLADGVRLELQLPDRQDWPRAAEPEQEPDILLLPGGEITPFQLRFQDDTGHAVAWLRVDDAGVITTSNTAEAAR